MDFYDNICTKVDTLKDYRYALENIQLQHVPSKNSTLSVNGIPNVPLKEDYYEEIIEQIDFLHHQLFEPLKELDIPFDIKAKVNENGQVEHDCIFCSVTLQLPHTPKRQQDPITVSGQTYNTLKRIVSIYSLFNQLEIDIKNHDIRRIVFSGEITIKEGFKCLQKRDRINQEVFSNWFAFIREMNKTALKFHSLTTQVDLFQDGKIATQTRKDAFRELLN
ncbi:hypothetical protein ACTWQB_16730 [Piscibacillus sp. B03]|uniref:hypothetical protein n=1 Tax=Piscibacillus sp. B03 TaxID=3457430 RepID=UPI003FCEA8C8